MSSPKAGFFSKDRFGIVSEDLGIDFWDAT
jgi:hypothetical protein